MGRPKAQRAGSDRQAVQSGATAVTNKGLSGWQSGLTVVNLEGESGRERKLMKGGLRGRGHWLAGQKRANAER